jgi:hypothetical protein
MFSLIIPDCRFAGDFFYFSDVVLGCRLCRVTERGVVWKIAEE